jgi:hypothetical protein
MHAVRVLSIEAAAEISNSRGETAASAPRAQGMREMPRMRMNCSQRSAGLSEG